MPNMLSRFVFLIDVVFSYLYVLSPEHYARISNAC